MTAVELTLLLWDRVFLFVGQGTGVVHESSRRPGLLTSSVMTDAEGLIEEEVIGAGGAMATSGSARSSNGESRLGGMWLAVMKLSTHFVAAVSEFWASLTRVWSKWWLTRKGWATLRESAKLFVVGGLTRRPSP